jgi:hypothetical protein
MRLSYRGQHYDYEPVPVDMAETNTTGHYRGHQFNFSYPRHIPVPQPILDLKYRGVAYRTSSSGLITTPQPAIQPDQEVVPVRFKPVKSNRQVLLREVAKIHSQNVQQRLQHRLDVARAKGDEWLVAQLEREMQQAV